MPPEPSTHTFSGNPNGEHELFRYRLIFVFLLILFCAGTVSGIRRCNTGSTRQIKIRRHRTAVRQIQVEKTTRNQIELTVRATQKNTPTANPPPAKPPRLPGDNEIDSNKSTGNRFAFDGMCPVTFVKTSRWKKGDKSFGCIHRGHTYLFVNSAAQRAFMMDPDSYSEKAWPVKAPIQRDINSETSLP